MKRRLILLAKLAVMAGLLAVLYRNVDFTAFRAALAGLAWGWIPLIYILLLLNTALNSWKWGLLLQADGIAIPLRSLMCSHLIGTFFNLFLPSSIGGDAYRVVDVGRRAGAKSFAAVFAVVQRTWLVAVWRLFRLDRLHKLDAFLHRFLDSLAGYHADRRLVAVVFGLSLVFQMIAITTIFCISQALHWDVPFVYFCIFVPLITLGEALPVSIFGIGVRDGLYVFFFAQAGAAREQALALALVYVLITIVYSLLGGALFLLRRPPAART